MRSDLKTLRINGHYLIAASLEKRVLVLQPDAKSVAYDINLEADCGEEFCISEDGGRLAAAYSSETSCCIEVLDLRPSPIITPETREQMTLHRFWRIHAIDVGLSPNGEVLVYNQTSRSASFAVDLHTGERVKLPKAHAPMNGAWLPNEVILPLTRGLGGLRVKYSPLTVTPTDLPSKKNVWRLIAHPSCDAVAMMDSKGYVASLRADTLEVLWRRKIPEAGWITYSGDGRFIAVRQQAPKTAATEGITLLNATSGDIVRQIEGPIEQARYPLDGPRFLCHSGRFLNAETGTFEEGVSTREFWKATLAWKSNATRNLPTAQQTENEASDTIERRRY